MEMPEKDCIIGEIRFETKDGGIMSLEELSATPLPPVLEKWFEMVKQILQLDFPIQCHYIPNDYFMSTIKDMTAIIELGFTEIERREIYIVQSSNGIMCDIHCLTHELLHFTGLRHRNAWEELNYEAEITRLCEVIAKGLNTTSPDKEI